MELGNDISELRRLLGEWLAQLSVLATENVSLREENAALRAQIATLHSENVELRRRLDMDSGNSHKPLSSDGYKKKTSKPALPKPKDKSVGGQPGHIGKTLRMVDTPDKTVVHHAANCSCCGRKFSAEESKGLLEGRRQVFDLPEPRLEVTEHRIGLITCCGIEHRGEFPQEIPVPVQYGVKALTLASMLNVDFRMPYQKVSQLFEDIYGSSFNERTLFWANKRLYEAGEVVENNIKEHLLASEVVQVDETGMRVEKRLQWFHTVCSDLLCYIFVHAKRGLEALNSQDSLLPKLKGWVVHDCWASYFKFERCKHALCNAHILRELQALVEQGSAWARQMQQLLLEIYQKSDYGRGRIEDFEPFGLRYEQICAQAHIEEPLAQQHTRGKPKNTKGRNLLNRLNTHQAAVLAFAQIEAVPFTNNRAEQDIRVIKTKQKVATSFRTFEGAKVYARIQAIIKTVRKHKLSLFQTLVQINRGNVPVMRYS